MNFTWNLSPLRPWKFSFQYLLLTPRSALEVASVNVTAAPSSLPPRPSTHLTITKSQMAEYRSIAWAPSIFRATWFGRWVVTHSLADFNFHDHRPAVYINQHLSWYLNERLFRHLNPASGASRIASSAYQKWPTKNSRPNTLIQLSNQRFTHI